MSLMLMAVIDELMKRGYSHGGEPGIVIGPIPSCETDG